MSAPAVASGSSQARVASLLDLAKSAEARGGVTPTPLNVTAHSRRASITRPLRTEASSRRSKDADATLKNEYVIVSAHFDHDGADGPRIFNGADDDGSGTVGLVEIADAFALAAQGGARPKRSIIFAAWNSEERGLLGAWGYTEDPVVPLDRIVAVLNMDMIGRDEEVHVGGGADFEAWSFRPPSRTQRDQRHRRAAKPRPAGGDRARESRDRRRPPIRYDNNVSNLMRRSDHWPFIQRGVPGVWIHTGPASRLSHRLRPSREDQLSEDGEDRADRLPDRVGPGERCGASAPGVRGDDDVPARAIRNPRSTQKTAEKASAENAETAESFAGCETRTPIC